MIIVSRITGAIITTTTRISFQDNGSGVAAVTQENEYYPFGMTMQGIVVRTPQNTTANKQLYNDGSELQDDLGFENSYSTPYREYDPQIGRFNAIDPMVDSYANWTPYNFAFNDPIGMNDPTGADPNQLIRPPGTPDDVWKMIENQWNATQMGMATHSGTDTNGEILAARIYKMERGYDQYGKPGFYVVTGGYNAVDSKGNAVEVNGTSGAFEADFIRAQDAPKSKGIGQPGAAESVIPVWGSGRSAIDHFQNGNYWTGAFYTAMAVSDVFLVKAAVTAIAKVAVVGVGKLAAKGGVTVVGEGMKRVGVEAAKHSEAVILNNMPKFAGSAEQVTSQMMTYNRQWLLQQMRSGRTIVDIGLDPTRGAPSIFYQMEQNMMKNYLKLHPNAFQIIK